MRKHTVKTRMIHARIEPRLLQSAARVFSKIGISTTEAIRLFLKQVELHEGLPFPITVPNAQTVAAMMEANNPAVLKRYRSFRELRKKI
jgi:DNA-damage-inducible protein J